MVYGGWPVVHIPQGVRLIGTFEAESGSLDQGIRDMRFVSRSIFTSCMLELKNRKLFLSRDWAVGFLDNQRNVY